MAINITDLIPSILTALVLLVAGWWLKNYLPNYFNEKGKLLAQKEDIEEITQKIENVKIEFTRESEYLKSGLQRLINLEITYRNEERNSIIEFYAKYNQWLFAIMEIDFSAFNRTNVKDIIEKRAYVEKFYSETGIAHSKVQLLVKDEEIISLSVKLFVLILDYKSWVLQKLLSLQQNLENQNYLTEEFLPLFKQFDANKDRLEKLAEEERELKHNMKLLVEDFYSNKLIEYKKIVPTNQVFTSKVKQYLTK